MTKAEKDAECKRRWREKNPEYRKQHYQKNKQKYIDKATQWNQDNPEKRKISRDAWSERNSDKFKAIRKDWVKRNPDRVKAMDKRFKKKHHQKIMARLNERYKDRRRTDPNFRILSYLRSRLSKVIRGNLKYAHTRTLLGCSLPDFITYLESKFEPGMTLENYGSVWHVDHIMPCAIFDMSKPDHQRRCFHFSNLQPMFAAENRKKWAKVTTNQFNLL